MKIDIEPSPPEIWIKIRFHNGSRSPSLCCFCEQNLFLLYIYNIYRFISFIWPFKIINYETQYRIMFQFGTRFLKWDKHDKKIMIGNLFIIRFKGKISINRKFMDQSQLWKVVPVEVQLRYYSYTQLWDIDKKVEMFRFSQIFNIDNIFKN